MSLLGPQPDRTTGSVLEDCKAALRTIDDFTAAIPFVRALILHVAHSQLYPAGGNGDTWLGVAQYLGRAKSTVHDWAHPAGWAKDM